MESNNAQIRINHLYTFCNDVQTMRHFYTNLIGLDEGTYNEYDSFSWIVYNSNGLCLHILGPADSPLPVPDDWSWQPGIGGPGTREATSWSIDVPEESFREVVRRIAEAEVRSHPSFPEWRQDCYWGLTVMDPMGTTVELMMEPATPPESTTWCEENV